MARFEGRARIALHEPNQVGTLALSIEAALRQDRDVVWTVGHSTHSIEDFVALLRAYDIEAVVDVRRFPASRRLPWFNASALSASLEAAGISYQSVPSLGGRRVPLADSPHTGWRHPSFRGYADHMRTEEFAEGLFELMVIAGGLRTTVMCAELLWWRCHRRLIADQLTALGEDVVHIETAQASAPHRIVAPARIVNGELRYDDGQPTLFEDGD